MRLRAAPETPEQLLHGRDVGGVLREQVALALVQPVVQRHQAGDERQRPEGGHVAVQQLQRGDARAQLRGVLVDV